MPGVNPSSFQPTKKVASGPKASRTSLGVASRMIRPGCTTSAGAVGTTTVSLSSTSTWPTLQPVPPRRARLRAPEAGLAPARHQ